MHIDPLAFGHLQFSWRVREVPSLANVSVAEHDDCPARLIVAFGGDDTRLPLRERLFFEQVELFTGQRLPYATLMYVWDGGTHEPESVHRNHRSARIQYLTVESGAQRAGRWLHYERDVVSDYLRVFGELPGPILGVVVLTDADALKYLASYQNAIRALAKGANGAGACETNDGISIKLSALHPRYEDAHQARVMAELVPRVWGRRMGILGLGRIGLAIAKRAAAFDMPIAYHNRRPRTDVPYWYYPNLVDMARDVDILMVATPGGTATHHIVTAEVIKALGPKGLIVNIARGSIIDELAMVKALKDGTLGGAALDVFEFEPKMPAELQTLENVVLMPHRGGGTYETWEDACDLVRDNVYAFYKTGKPLTPIAETPID